MYSAGGGSAKDSVGGVESEDGVDAPVGVIATGTAGAPLSHEVMADGEKLFDEFEELEDVVEDDFW